MTRGLCGLILLSSALAVHAHSGVQNEAVMARMMLMERIAGQTKLLGEMVRGLRSFDAVAAGQAKAAILNHAVSVPEAFEARESDPKSEALPAIWEDWDAFVAANTALEEAARALDPGTPETLAQGMAALGAACKACHKDFRLP